MAVKGGKSVLDRIVECLYVPSRLKGGINQK